MTTELTINSPCEVRVKYDACQRTPWLSAVRVDSNQVQITADDPVWRGALVNLKDAGLQVRKGSDA